MKVFLLAVLVTMTGLFTACSSDDSLSDVQETEITGAPVKAQFTITIPMSTGVTRQASAVTQDGANADVSKFRGINHIKLFPLTVESSNIDGSSTLGAGIQLLQMLKPISQSVSNYIPKTGLWANNKSVLYNDVALSTGTKSFLFYGKAIDETANETALTDATKKFQYGILNATVADAPGTPSAISFSPVIITSATNSNTKRTALCTYINSIANAHYTEGSETKYWKDNTLVGYNSLYQQFISMKAGSSTDLEAAVEDLYNSLKGSDDDMAKAICTAIEAGDVTHAAPTATLDKYTITFGSALSGYPSTSDNLPDGAANIEWTSTGFNYIEDTSNASAKNVTPIDKFVYPANLYYWVKSGIMTSKNPQSSNFTSTMTWDNDESTGIFNKFKDGGTITSNTQSLILTSPVQYGVGRLDIKVAASGSTLPDNGASKSDGQKNVNLSDIKLTGIIIGSQNTVGWNFQPTGTEGYSMYDNILKSTANTTGIAIGTENFDNTSVMNQTLVLETAGPTGDATGERVNVALEFINNGPDFWGADGIVAQGTRFYLVGKLDTDPTNGNSTIPSGYEGKKVFKQDFVTYANFTLVNLTKATNVIPDLRNPRLELGLSVDLTWQEGVTFGYTFE